MLAAPDEFVWEALSAETETFPIGDVELCVLGPTALAQHVVVHAVQHRFQHHTREDLRRAVAVMSVDDWRSVADLAAGLGIAEILGFGLHHHSASAEIADGLSLPSLSLTSSQFRMRFAPRGSASLTGFWAADAVGQGAADPLHAPPKPGQDPLCILPSRRPRAHTAARLCPMVAEPRARHCVRGALRQGPPAVRQRWR
jgi:hypothetical protein